MIHDFATAPRETDWRQPARVERQKPTTQKQRRAVSKDQGPSAPFRLRVLLPVLGVATLAFGVQAMVSGQEPVLDQQPDEAAKREYAEALLLTETEDSANLAAEPDTLSRDVAASKLVHEEAALQQADDGVPDASDTQRVVKTVAVSTETGKGATAANQADPDVIDIQVDPDFGFYDSLKQGSWPVPINKGVYVDGELAERERPVYKLQAASFRNKSDADRLAARLKKERLSAVVVPSVASNGQYWYQVSVGPFISTTKMNKAKDILVSMSMMPLKKRVQ